MKVKPQSNCLLNWVPVNYDCLKLKSLELILPNIEMHRLSNMSEHLNRGLLVYPSLTLYFLRTCLNCMFVRQENAKAEWGIRKQRRTYRRISGGTSPGKRAEYQAAT